MKRTDYELKMLSKWWLDLSKIILGSIAIKLFKPGGPSINLGSSITAFTGLILSLTCTKVGLICARKVKSL